jgi:antitoxin component YwqK of YwqJK toxin-antitoxin module
MNIEYDEMEFEQLVNEDIEAEIVDGYGEYFNPYGVLIYKGFFKNGKPNGQCQYYICSILAYDGEWKDGQYNGYGKEFEENTFYQGEFRDGLYYGKGAIYHNGGKLQVDGNFKKSQIDGYAKKFYEDGNLEYEGEFSNNKYSGKGKLYSRTGSLIKSGEFINGNLINEKAIDKNVLKAFSIMKYIESRGEVCDTCIKQLVKEVTDKKQLSDIIIDILKDVEIPRAQLAVADSYAIKGAIYRKKYIEYLEKFLSNDKLTLSDFNDNNRIYDGSCTREVEEYEKDKELIKSYTKYLRKQQKRQLIRNYKSEKMYDKVIELSNEDIKAGSFNSDTYIDLAEVYAKQKDYTKAEENYKKAIALVEAKGKLDKRTGINFTRVDSIHQHIAALYLKQYNAHIALEYLESLNETSSLKSIKEFFREHHKRALSSEQH